VAELVALRSIEGMSRVINLDQVIEIQDMPNNQCLILTTNGDRIVAAMSASAFARLGRLTP
jgi:hypothetical protein